MYKNIVIIGNSGAIGSAFIKEFSDRPETQIIHSFGRSKNLNHAAKISFHYLDYNDESSIENAAFIASQNNPIDLVLVTTGILHDHEFKPEKSFTELSADKFQKLFEINTIIPAMLAKHFLNKINKNKRSVFAALSARLGSISDNQLGGWYSYRASKSALNMFIKTTSIEMKRRSKKTIVVGLHPGTVKSRLSKPFHKSVQENKLFTPEYSVRCLISVLDKLTVYDSGKCFAWDGKEIKP